jgi:hypothetical protein
MIKKLEGIPSIYYLNLDSEIERREYMESQFEKWELKNGKRFSGAQYLAKNYNDWKNIVHFNDIVPDRNHFHLKISIVISTLDMIRYWLETTNEQYLILMEDDYDLNLIEYWHFDWEYLMNNIPYDWDCIQLGYESWRHIKFFLHPKDETSWWGPVLINRHYAEKLITLHYIHDKYLLIRKYGLAEHSTKYRVLGLDDSICRLGKIYQLPLITQNPILDIVPKESHFICRDAYYDWWQKQRDNYSLSEFFSYGKPNDGNMTFNVLDVLKST